MCVHGKHQTAVSSLWLEVRSFETFSILDRRRLSPEKNHYARHHLEITQRMGVLHFKYKIWLRDWFSSVPNVLFVKKILQFICTYSTYVRTFEQEEKKRRGSSAVWNYLARAQTYTANGERDRWSLVTRLLDVCGHTYSETNVDLKLPNDFLFPSSLFLL